LPQNSVDEVGLQHGIYGAHQRLIANKKIARAAGVTDAAAIFRIADQLPHVSSVLYHVANRQTIIGVDLVVEPGKPVVVVVRFQN